MSTPWSIERRGTGCMAPTEDQPDVATVRIGNVDIHDLPLAEAEEHIWRLVEARAGGVVCTPNADYVVRARADEEFREAIASADLRLPDGMGVVYASRIAGRPIRGTATGRLLLPALAGRAATHGMRVVLFGARPGVATQAASRLSLRYPKLAIEAISPPDAFVVGSADDAAAVVALRKGNPRLIFVALGAPKQEIWMQRHRAEFTGAVLVGVGAAFDIVAGRFREAPPWMTAVGLEWAFRLAQEPRRLARRYLLDDPWIIWWALNTRFRVRGRNLPRKPAA